jgi:hypothetical protein
MPGTVDDFMQRFGGGGTTDESQAEQYHDRFVSSHPDDRSFDNNTYHQAATQYLGKLPDAQFHDAARNAVTQAPSARALGPVRYFGECHRWRRRGPRRLG